MSVEGGKATLRFASSPEAAARSQFDKDTDVSGYVLRADLSKAGYYFECYKGRDKLHFFRAESAVALRNWMAVFVAAGLTRGPSLDPSHEGRMFEFDCWKRGGGAKSSAWRRRWLRLFDREIRYWSSDADDAPPKGTIDVVQSLIVLDATPDTSITPHLHVLRLSVIGREYTFGFSEAEERQQFSRALQSYGAVIDAFAEENIAQQIGGADGHKAESIRDSMIRNSVAIARVAVDGDDDAAAATRARTVSRVTVIMEAADASDVAELNSRFKEISASSSAPVIKRLAGDFKAAADALPPTSANAIFARSREAELMGWLQAAEAGGRAAD